MRRRRVHVLATVLVSAGTDGDVDVENVRSAVDAGIYQAVVAKLDDELENRYGTDSSVVVRVVVETQERRRQL